MSPRYPQKFSWFIVLSLFIPVQFVSANPPKEIKLNYDKDKSVLIVEITHMTRDRTEHYIRKIFVSKNQEDPISSFFVGQAASTGFTVEIPIDLAPGDTVRVKAICNEAGFKEETTVIP